MNREPNLDVPVGLEQRRIGPGRWLIEGYDVFRLRPGGWSVQPQDIAEHVHLARTLAEVREWIATQVNGE